MNFEFPDYLTRTSILGLGPFEVSRRACKVARVQVLAPVSC